MKTDVLIIEDSPEDADLAVRVLSHDNPTTRIKVITDGIEAMNYLFDDSGAVRRQHMPKLIYLDMKLPKLSGSEVLKRLKSNETTKCTPVVIMTSSKQKPDIDECYRLGANSYLVKPIDFQSFQNLFVLSSRYWLNYNISAFS